MDEHKIVVDFIAFLYGRVKIDWKSYNGLILRYKVKYGEVERT